MLYSYLNWIQSWRLEIKGNYKISATTYAKVKLHQTVMKTKVVHFLPKTQ